MFFHVETWTTPVKHARAPTSFSSVLARTTSTGWLYHWHRNAWLRVNRISDEAPREEWRYAATELDSKLHGRIAAAPYSCLGRPSTRRCLQDCSTGCSMHQRPERPEPVAAQEGAFKGSLRGFLWACQGCCLQAFWAGQPVLEQCAGAESVKSYREGTCTCRCAAMTGMAAHVPPRTGLTA
eukprot:356927-Chlamydomonas_euryale.AAC.3